MKELVPHNVQWKSDFQKESKAVSIALGDIASTVHHMGSTSIPGIYAKPIIDILVEVTSVDNIDTKNTAMMKLGYECMGEYGIAGRRYFRKVDSQGSRTHHVHMFKFDSEHISRHLAFRDYLIAHPLKAQEYSNLKKALAIEHGDNWNSYLDGKDPFIKKTEQLALHWIRKRA